MIVLSMKDDHSENTILKKKLQELTKILSLRFKMYVKSRRAKIRIEQLMSNTLDVKWVILENDAMNV